MAPTAPSGAARAEQAPPKPRKLDKAAIEEAKCAYAAGEMAYKAGDYKTAIQNFRDAQSILPSPQASYWLALSLKADGQVPEAIAELKTLLASPLSEKLGPEKLTTANAALEELKKVPGVIALSSEPPGATVSVDGEVRPGVSPLNVELAPGAHTLTVSLPGYQSMELELEVPPGSKGEQKLTLTALPKPPPAAAGAPAPTAPTQHVVLKPTGTVAPKASHLGTYVVFGLAGAGAIVGSVFGILALNAKSDFDKNPTDEAADDIERNATISDIGFGAAITLGLTGLVMATASDDTGGGTREKPTAARGSKHPMIFALSPYAGPRGGGANASWRF